MTDKILTLIIKVCDWWGGRMKLLCKLFGHKWVRYHYDFETCERCRGTRINRSGLDESSGSHEKWLDKHID